MLGRLRLSTAAPYAVTYTEKKIMSQRNSQAAKSAARERIRAQQEAERKREKRKRSVIVGVSIVAVLAIAGGVGYAVMQSMRPAPAMAARDRSHSRVVLLDDRLQGVALVDPEVPVRVLLRPRPRHVQPGEVDAEPEPLGRADRCLTTPARRQRRRRHRRGGTPARRSAPSTFISTVARRKSSIDVSVVSPVAVLDRSGPFPHEANLVGS